MSLWNVGDAVTKLGIDFILYEYCIQ